MRMRSVPAPPPSIPPRPRIRRPRGGSAKPHGDGTPALRGRPKSVDIFEQGEDQPGPSRPPIPHSESHRPCGSDSTTTRSSTAASPPRRRWISPRRTASTASSSSSPPRSTPTSTRPAGRVPPPGRRAGALPGGRPALAEPGPSVAREEGRRVAPAEHARDLPARRGGRRAGMPPRPGLRRRPARPVPHRRPLGRPAGRDRRRPRASGARGSATSACASPWRPTPT